jgi:subtilisin family serine protease
VAWKSNLYSFHHADDTWGLSGWDAALGVSGSINAGAKIVTMAFQVQGSSDVIADWIRYGYYQHDMLFIGAAGTSGWFLPNSNVVFPAEMAEVFAVTGADYSTPYGACGDCHYGSKVELTAYISQATHGMDAGRVTDIKGSSVAAAVVAGAAGLIYQRYPNASRDWVAQRLRYSGRDYPSRDGNIGYGVINLFKAVGGFVNLGMRRPALVARGAQFTVEALPVGDGPFQYSWSNGATGKTTTYEAPYEDGMMTVSVWVTDTTDWESKELHVNVMVGKPRPIEPIE